MAGLFGIFNLGGSALRASQRALATTSHNIANAQTPGFSRQRALQTPAEAAAHPKGALPGGVDIQVVERLVDRFAERELLAGREGLAYADARAKWLDPLQGVFNETDVDGVGAAMGNLFNAFRALAATPRDGAARARVRDAALAVTAAFGRAARGLESVRTGIEESIVTALAEANALAARVASLNAAIVRAEAAGGPANDLRDQRDEAARQLAEQLGGQILEGPGGVTVLVAGRPIVERDRAWSFSAQTASGESRIVARDPAGNATDVTSLLTRGSLGAALDVRDRILPGFAARLDALAFDLVTRVNEVHRAGAGLDGVSGRDLFAPLAGPTGAAASLAVSSAVLATTDAVAAATDPADPGDNRNALALAAVGDEARAALGGLRAPVYYATLAGDAGRAAADAEGLRGAEGERLAQAQALREQVSGVSVDEELVKTLELQGGFQAAAKLIQVVDQLLDALLKI
jgi:flagellar hook-associated protein 1 FlgK